MLLASVTGGIGRSWSAPLPVELDGPDTLVLAFGAPGDESVMPLAALDAAFPRSVVVGCSTAGEIAGDQVSDGTLSVAIARFEHTHLRHAEATVRDAETSRTAGQILAEKLAPDCAGEPLRAVFLLADGLSVNGTLLTSGLAAALPDGVVITGGLAADGSRFRRTWLAQAGRQQPNIVSAVGFYGDRIRVGHGCSAGWSDFGPERRITRAEGNVLYELDGQPALALYKTYLGDLASGLPGTALLFPLALRRDGSQANHLIRTVVGVDDDAQSMTFAGDIPLGASARLMRANTDRLIDSAGTAAGEAMASMPGGSPMLVISVSCVGRRLVLGERTDEEVETVLGHAPEHSVHVGFYSYGEIAPSGGCRFSDLHNQTMTVTALAEA